MLKDFLPSLQKVFDTITNVFSILDFSYLISGSIGYAILYAGYKISPITINFPQDIWIRIFFSSIIVYVLGIFSGAAGHWVRKKMGKISKSFYPSTSDEIYECALAYGVFSHFTNNKENTIIRNSFGTYGYHTYTLLWTKLSTKQEAQERLMFINRFWVMQKVYEGLMTNCIFAIILVMYAMHLEKISINITVCSALAIIIVFLVFTNESARNYQTQVKEVVMAYCTYFEPNNLQIAQSAVDAKKNEE